MKTADTARETEQTGDQEFTESRDPVPAVVDWLIGIFIGLFGLALTGAGLSILLRVDRTLIADTVRSDDFDVDGLTEAEFIDAAVPFVDWFSAGLVLTGLFLIVGVGIFVVKRQRTRRRVSREGGTTATFLACSVYGAAVTILTSYIPGSAIAGGGAAAYLYDGNATRIGAVSGLVGSLFTIPITFFLIAGFVAGATAIGELAVGVLLVTIIAVGELFTVGLTVGFGALGGYVADRLL
jgi:hypothetical protein